MPDTQIDVDVTGTTAEELIELIERSFGEGYLPFHQCAGVMWVASYFAEFTNGWSHFDRPNCNALRVSVEIMRWLGLSDDSDLVPKDGQGNPTRPSGAIGWHVVSSSIEDVPVLVITPVLA